jgi:hypothetical protein
MVTKKLILFIYLFVFFFLAKKIPKLNSTTTTITISIQFIIILAGALAFLLIIILVCFTGIIFKHRKKQKLNRFGEKLILQTCHNDQLKLQIPCCNNIDKDTQSSSKFFFFFHISIQKKIKLFI